MEGEKVDIFEGDLESKEESITSSDFLYASFSETGRSVSSKFYRKIHDMARFENLLQG